VPGLIPRPKFDPFWPLCKPLGSVISFQGPTPITLTGGPTVVGDRLMIIPQAALDHPDPEPAIAAVDLITRLDVVASGVGTFDIHQTEVTRFHHDHLALGLARLQGSGSTLRVSNIGSSGEDGVKINFRDSRLPFFGTSYIQAFGTSYLPRFGAPNRFSAHWQPLDPRGTVPAGSSLEIKVNGALRGSPEQCLGAVRIADIGPTMEITADYTPVGVTSRRLVVLNNGVTVATVPGNTGLVARVAEWPGGCGKVGPPVIIGPNPPIICIWVDWPLPIPINLGLGGGLGAASVGQTVMGTELRILAENAPAPADYLSEFEFRAAGIPEMVFYEETSGLPLLTIRRVSLNNNNVIIEWDPAIGKLQQTGQLLGDGPPTMWMDVPNNPSSPFTTPATSQQFYRVFVP
jgi:hypothetical protein